MSQPVEDKCVCCFCCDLCAWCTKCTNFCDCECNYDCNCLAKFWFCKPDVCFPLFRISIYPCMLPFCASYTTVCCSLHLAALILMVACCGGGGETSSSNSENPCKTCDECDDAWMWIPLRKMWNVLFCTGGLRGYERSRHYENGEHFWSTSSTCFNKTFCTKPQSQKADIVTVQPQAQEASMPSSVPKFASDELPSYAQFEAFSAISKIELVPGNRETWMSVSDVSDV